MSGVTLVTGIKRGSALPGQTDGSSSDASGAQRDQARLVLEWPSLLAVLAGYAASGAGRARLLALESAATPEESRSRSARVRALLALHEHGVELPSAAFPDVAPTLERLALGGDASGPELGDAARLLAHAARLRALGETHAAEYPELRFLAAIERRIEGLGARLERCLEPSGSVADAASPTLADARARAREVSSELRHRLGELARQHAEVLQGQYFTERDGRFVLPVRADAHYRVEGIVLGSSGSGSTLFVEPSEVTRLGNRLRVREAAVQREEARVLAELSGAVREVLDAVRGAFEACVAADVFTALARWAIGARAQALDVTDEPSFELQAARHPLLVASGLDVVPNDIALGAGRALVVSGPNAGGKTVVLKCLGLFALMARAGVPLPTHPDSRVGWFDEVFADIGDEQSIVTSLSTFSAHVRRLGAILAQARHGALVLLDEVAAGTDPEEGAALAAAVLEALTAQGAAVGVTTHYERLKELAASGGALGNASVGFDFEVLAPTFRLTLGVPGPSSALLVAARHGILPAVVARAKQLLPRESRDREQAVRDLELAHERLLAERQELADERRRQGEEAAALVEERRQAEEAGRAEIERETRNLVEHVRSARRELDRARERLKAQRLDATDLRRIERAVSRVAGEVAIGGALAQPFAAPAAAVQSGARAPSADELTPGASVRVLSTGATGVVIEPPSRGSVLVRVGAVRVRQKLEELALAPAAKPAARAGLSRGRGAPAFAEAIRTSDNTLDLRGTRVEDAAGLLDGLLDRMLGEGVPVGFVLHGHGTGALRSAVREHLGSSSYVERVRPATPDEGGEAFTVFWVK